MACPVGVDQSVWNELPDSVKEELLLEHNPSPDIVEIDSSSSESEAHVVTSSVVEISLMTYNVWFVEEVALRQRMEGIIALVAKHNPAFLGMQELTPSIMRLLAPSLRSLGYHHTATQSNGAPYFVQLCSRYPLSHHCVRDFPTSIMGRCLAMAVADTPLGKIALGCTHLESAIGPWMGTGHAPDNKSSERVRQLDQALRWLREMQQTHGAVAAVLLGDLNWKDKVDGQPRLPEGCSDVWQSTHASGDPGFTYDGPRNQMLLSKFRDRFDRLFLMSRVLTAQSSALLGTEPLPGVTYVHRSGKQLPVLCSDHYGLIATLSTDKPPSLTENPPKAETEPARPLKRKATATGQGTLATFFQGSKRAKGQDTPTPGSPLEVLGVVLRPQVRQVGLPCGWGVADGSLLVSSWGSEPFAPRVKCAAFDFDGCVARTNPLRGTSTEWSFQFSHIPQVMRKLHSDGYMLVLMSNESMVRLKTSEAISRAIERKCGRMKAWSVAIGLPILCLAATAGDKYRKPQAGMWEWVAKACGALLRGDATAVSKAESFYVGDAAGRAGDHSDSDARFAENVGVRFYNEKEFFTREHPPPG